MIADPRSTGPRWTSFGERYLLAATALLFGSAVLGAFVDNIPYTAAMAPTVEDLVAAGPDPAAGRPLWWAFALGADLGGNTTAVVARSQRGGDRAGRPARPADQLLAVHPYGLLVTAMTLVLAWVYVWLRYYPPG